MKNISKSLMLACTLIACGLDVTLYAPPRGGGHGGGGSMKSRGGFRSSGASRIHSSGAIRTSSASRAGTSKIGSSSTISKSSTFASRPSRISRSSTRYGARSARSGYYRGGYGRRWGHRYPYRYGLYPWGVYLLTEPWWRTYNWDNFYVLYPDTQNEIDLLRAELAQNMLEMRQKDRRLAALEDRLDEALGENAQAGLKKKIAQLKRELRKQAEKTEELDARLKQKIGKD